MTQDAGGARRGGLSELAEDAVGFGGQELRLTRDLLLRPRAVMDAYDAGGSNAGGLYPKPMRYYITLFGLYLLLISLLGGLEQVMSSSEASEQLLGSMVPAGKSLDEFRADFDQWYSLLSIPLTAIFFGGASFLLIRRWSPGSDHQDFQQTFTYLNAYSVLAIPLGLIALLSATVTMWMLPVTFVLMGVTYARVGAGRWWRTRAGAWGKGAALLGINFLALIPASICMMGFALLGARYLP